MSFENDVYPIIGLDGKVQFLVNNLSSTLQKKYKQQDGSAINKNKMPNIN